VRAQPLDDKTVTAFAHDAAAAPSLLNAQPWRFRYHTESRIFEVFADPQRAIEHVDPQGRALHIGCGAALLNLRVSVAHAGWEPETRLLPDPADPTLVATVTMAGPGPSGTSLGLLHSAIRRRHTSRYPFAETEISDTVRASLSDAARLEGGWLTFPGPVHLQSVLDLIQDAESRNAIDPGAQTDLARWTRLGTAESDTATDGVPEYAFGPRKRGGRAPVRDFASRRPVADRGITVFESNPQLALLSTAGDRPHDWLRVGQALQRVLLLATVHGLSSSFATQAVEHPELRWALRDPLSGLGTVQMVLRLGYGPEGPATPRRPVREVLEIVP
jgi:nitroreductase